MKVSIAVPAAIAVQAHRRLPPPLPQLRDAKPADPPDPAGGRPARGVAADGTRGTRVDLRV